MKQNKKKKKIKRITDIIIDKLKIDNIMIHSLL